MPKSRPQITSDFPVGDQKGEIVSDDAIEVTFIRRYKNGFFKTEPAFMSAGRFKKLIKETGYRPSWQQWAAKTQIVGDKVVEVTENGKPVKEWQKIEEPEKIANGQRAIQ